LSKLGVSEATSLEHTQVTGIAVGHARQNDILNERIEATVASPVHVSVLEFLKGRLCIGHTHAPKSPKALVKHVSNGRARTLMADCVPMWLEV
jgi:hypothetical protein